MKKFFGLAVFLCICAQTALSHTVGISPLADKREIVADTVTDLIGLEVVGKSQTETLREGVYNVTAIDIKSLVNTSATLGDIVNRAPGVRLRSEGGKGSDFEFSLNGMSGNSIRYFIDGVSLDTKGSGFDISNFLTVLIDRVEIYKGVVPAWLASDALGGAVNIVTKRNSKNYLDASVSGGSYHIWQGDAAGRYTFKNGIIVKPSLSIGYSKNDYTVRGARVWSEEDDAYVSRDMKRFHDDYFSAMASVEAGVENRRWADLFYIGAGWSEIRKDIQTGAVQNVVYGMAERHTDTWNVEMRYRKRNFFTEGLTVNINASYTHDNSCTIDTAYRKYSWDGTWIPTSRNEISGNAKMMRHYERPLTMVRANFDYALADWHSLNLNFQMTANGNYRYDTYDVSFESTKDYFTKSILGLTYSQNLFDGKMNNTVFLKDYISYVKIGQTDDYWITGSIYVPEHATKQNIGYGLGTRYLFAEPFALKFSYEHSVRLPLARELLGNGTTVYPNLRLKPEQSHNFNLGVDFDKSFDSYAGHEGKLVTIDYLGNNKCLCYIQDPKYCGIVADNTMKSGWGSNYNCYYAILDMSTNNLEPVKCDGVDLPFRLGTFAQRCVVVNNKAYIGVNPEKSEPCIYVMDLNTMKVEKGASITDGYTFDMIRYLGKDI